MDTMFSMTGDQSQVDSYQTQQTVLDASLLNTQLYMVQIKGKMEQSREKTSVLTYTG